MQALKISGATNLAFATHMSYIMIKEKEHGNAMLAAGLVASMVGLGGMCLAKGFHEEKKKKKDAVAIKTTKKKEEDVVAIKTTSKK